MMRRVDSGRLTKTEWHLGNSSSRRRSATARMDVECPTIVAWAAKDDSFYESLRAVPALLENAEEIAITGCQTWVWLHFLHSYVIEYC